MAATTQSITIVPVYLGAPPVLEGIVGTGFRKKVTISCPYCHDKHSHYLGVGMEDDTHWIQREAPCLRGNGEYKIRLKREKNK